MTDAPRWGEGLTGEEMKALKGIVPDDTPVDNVGTVKLFRELALDAFGRSYHLPANSPVYTVRDRNAKHPDERPWIPHCGDTCPADWDGKAVLLKNGAVCWISAPCWNNSGPQWKVAGYRRLAEPATESEEGVVGFSPADIEQASAEVARLQSELDITNADHIALWLEANMVESSLGWLACRIVEAHERATTPTDTVTLPRMTEAEFRSAYQGYYTAVDWAKRVGLIRPTPIEALRTAHPGKSDTDLCVMLLEQRGEG